MRRDRAEPLARPTRLVGAPMEPEAAGPEGGNVPPVSTNEGRQRPRPRAWRWPAFGLGAWMLVGFLGLMALVGGSTSSMGVFIFGPLVRGVASIWIGGLFVLLVWLLVAAMSAKPPARAAAVIAALGLIGAIAADLSMMGSAAPSSSSIWQGEGRVPPVGAIWLGSVYNSDTHGLLGCSADVTVGCEAGDTDRLYILVAHLPRAIHEAVDIRWGGTAIPHTKTVPADGEFLVDWDFGPFTEPGYNTVSVIDHDGNSLASSEVDVWGP